MVEVRLNVHLLGRGEQVEQFRIVEPLRQGHGNAGADANHFDVIDRLQVVQVVAELGKRQGERVAAGDDHVLDRLRLADVIDHAFVVGAHAFPAAAGERGALPRAVPAVHRAVGRGDEQRAIRIPVGEPRHGRILVLFQRVFEFVPGGVLGFQRRGDGLQPDGIGRILRVDEREVVRRDGELVLALEPAECLEFVGSEREECAKLADGPNRVLGLPAPVVPLMGGNIVPEWESLRRVLVGRATRGFGFFKPVHRGGNRRASERASI